MASEIEVVSDHHNSSASLLAISTSDNQNQKAIRDGKEKEREEAQGVEGKEVGREDIYTAAAYGDLEKLHRLVEQDHCSVSVPDNGGFFALQWSSLNNRVASAQYIIEVQFPFPSSSSHFSLLPLCIVCVN